MRKKTILDVWSDIVRKDIAALRAIADGEPDARLSQDLNAAVPHLVKRGWLQACGCSDGDYVVLTKSGRRALQKVNPAP